MACRQVNEKTAANPCRGPNSIPARHIVQIKELRAAVEQSAGNGIPDGEFAILAGRRKRVAGRAMPLNSPTASVLSPGTRECLLNPDRRASEKSIFLSFREVFEDAFGIIVDRN
jgi:hypothetical protein